MTFLAKAFEIAGLPQDEEGLAIVLLDRIREVVIHVDLTAYGNNER